MVKTRKKTTKPRKRTQRQKNKRSIKKKILKILFLAVFSLFVFVCGYVFYCALGLPDINTAFQKTRRPSTTIIAENGNEIATFGNSFTRVVYLSDLPSYVPLAITSVEDRRFYEHFGVDIISLTRAVFVNLFKKRYAQGASTITQQVAKNLFLTPQKSIKRKVQELLIAFWLEHKFTKDQILTLYLNRVYLGSGAYGIEAASNKYFGKSSSDLSIKEAAVIAGMLKAPSRYNPIYSKKNACDRAAVVLSLMKKSGYISEDEYQKAIKEPLYETTKFKVEGAKHFADMILSEVTDYIGTQNQDIYVATTLDQDLQQKTESVVKNMVLANFKNNVHEGAVVILDYSGAIKALVGGIDYQKNQFNRAIQALRQPGSAFKTFVYITALQHSFEPSDIISDKPMHIGKWKPENYNKKYAGDVSLSYAFEQSLNLATVDLSRKFSLNDVIKNAKKMGITTPLNKTPALVLGTSEVKVIDMASAYLSIASGGYSIWPYAISDIYTKDGKLLYKRHHDQDMRILDERTVAKITEMLQNVIKRGTGKNADTGSFVAGKTGTSQDYRDAWFVGFTKDYVAAIWVGNDDNTPMKGVTGGDLPARIFKKIFSENL